MRNLIALSCLALIVVFTSCQKEYVCVCTNTTTGHVTEGDKMKANVFTKKATEEGCANNDELSGGSLKDCHLEP
jgi:hypothetical protein